MPSFRYFVPTTDGPARSHLLNYIALPSEPTAEVENHSPKRKLERSDRTSRAGTGADKRPRRVSDQSAVFSECEAWSFNEYPGLDELILTWRQGLGP